MSKEEKIDQAKSIIFQITSEGNLIFPWWNPLAQEIIEAADGVIIENAGSKFCG